MSRLISNIFLVILIAGSQSWAQIPGSSKALTASTANRLQSRSDFVDVIADCGLKGAGANCRPGTAGANCHDDSQALSACLQPFKKYFFPKTTNIVAGCDYFFTQPIHIVGNSIWLEGTVTETFGVGDILCFAPGVSGITAHNLETIDVHVKNLVLWGGDEWQAVGRNRLGAAIYWPHDFNNSTESGTIGLNDATASGPMIHLPTGTARDQGGTYIVKICSTGTWDGYQWGYYPFRRDFPGGYYTGLPPVTYSPCTPMAGPRAANTIDNGVKITWAASTGHTIDDAWTINAGGVALDITCPKCNQTQPIGTSDGIEMEAPHYLIQNVVIKGFARHGFYCNSFAHIHGGAGNCDLGKLDFVDAVANRGNGFHFQGADSNANQTHGIKASSNQGWGLKDASFLGNQHYSPFTQANGLGSFNSTTYSGQNQFYGTYAESDQPPSHYSGRTLVIPFDEGSGTYGGNILATFGGAQDSKAGYNSGLFHTTPLWASKPPAGKTSLTLGNVIAGLASTSGADTNTALQLINNGASNSFYHTTELRHTSSGGAKPCAGYYGNSGWWGFRSGSPGDAAGCLNYSLLLGDLDTVEAGWSGSIAKPVYNGSGGLNDASSGGALQPGPAGTYTVRICASGKPDSWQYKASFNVQPNLYSNCKPMAPIADGKSANTLDHGVQIIWAANTGHTKGDTWTIATSITQGTKPAAWMPNGFYLGTAPTTGRRCRVYALSQPPNSGGWNYCDVVLNSSPPTSGVGAFAWVCPKTGGCSASGDWSAVPLASAAVAPSAQAGPASGGSSAGRTGVTANPILWSAFLPEAIGSYPLGTVFTTWTITAPITVTRFEIQQSTNSAALSGCTIPPTVSLTDGVRSVALTLANGSQYFDSGLTSQHYAAGSKLQLKITKAGINCSNGAYLTFNVQH